MGMLVVGIDPGLTGAVCFLNTDGTVAFFDTPTVKIKSGKKTKNRYVPEQMAEILRGCDAMTSVVVLEFASTRPGMAAGAVLATGKGWGLWRGIAATLSLPVEDVTPQSWKGGMLGKGIGGDKGASIRRACQLYPAAASQLSRAKDDGRAEALLMATYYKRCRGWA